MHRNSQYKVLKDFADCTDLNTNTVCAQIAQIHTETANTKFSQIAQIHTETANTGLSQILRIARI